MTFADLPVGARFRFVYTRREIVEIDQRIRGTVWRKASETQMADDTVAAWLSVEPGEPVEVVEDGLEQGA